MSFVFAAPEALAAAAADMAGIGSTLNAANVVAAVPTTGVLAAAADEVSTQVAALLSAHAQGYQQLSRQMMTAFHDQFVQALRASADAYATAEASAAQTMVNAVNAPARALLGHPLISADASTGGGSNALSRVQSMFLGTGGSSALGGSAAANAAASGALQLQPTGGASGLSAVGALLPRAGAAAAAALPALAAESIGNAIKNSTTPSNRGCSTASTSPHGRWDGCPTSAYWHRRSTSSITSASPSCRQSCSMRSTSWTGQSLSARH